MLTTQLSFPVKVNSPEESHLYIDKRVDSESPWKLQSGWCIIWEIAILRANRKTIIEKTGGPTWSFQKVDSHWL